METYSVTLRIQCDACGFNENFVAHTKKEARQLARNVGWRSFQLPSSPLHTMCTNQSCREKLYLKHKVIQKANSAKKKARQQREMGNHQKTVV